MKFKDYLNSLVSKRKTNVQPSKPYRHSINTKHHQESKSTTDCHYDICSYDDIKNGITPDDHHSRTQVLLARHAELVNTIVEARSTQDTAFLSCFQCRHSQQPSLNIPPPPLPPPIPPKLSLDQQLLLANRNYSSTLATCSPQRECHQQQVCHLTHMIAPQYSTPTSNPISSSNSSLWTTASTTTAVTTSFSRKQRSRIRTNPWIGNTCVNSRPTTFIESTYTSQPSVPPSIPSSSHPEYFTYDPTYRTSSAGLIHSESFPERVPNGIIHSNNSSVPAPTPTKVVSSVHQSDSGHGFSLASSRVINSSSSPSSSSASSPSSSSSPPSSSSSPNTTSGAENAPLNNRQPHRQKKLKKKIPSISPPSIAKTNQKHKMNNERYFYPNTIASDSGSLTRRINPNRMSPPRSLQYAYERPSYIGKISPIKTSIDRIQQKYHSHSSSSHSIDDHFSLEFEEILENQRSCKQTKYKQPSATLVSPTSISSRKSPFILPLDETNIKITSPTLSKTNSRAILKHIEDIENEIQLIKNLDLTNHNNDNIGDNDDDDDKCVLLPYAYSEDIDIDEQSNKNHIEQEMTDERSSIYEQVDQWVDKCLKTTNNKTNMTTILHDDCDQLLNTIKDYVECVCNNDSQQISTEKHICSNDEPPMTIFYLSSVPNEKSKRSSSLINQACPLKLTSTVTNNLKSTNECPF